MLIFFFLGCLFWMQTNAFGQNCVLSVSGYVLETETGQPLAYANIRLETSQKIWQSDSLGFFRLDSLCAIPYRLQVSHIGCETTHEYLLAKKDTSIFVFLQHRPNTIKGIEILAENTSLNTLSQTQISQSANKNLADILAEMAGVSVLKNGAGISKPVVQGLFGNRITILNNGIAQAGQQWGNDHAPEIDAFVADELQLLRGVKTLAYNTQSLSGLVLVEVQPIPDMEGKRIELNHIFASNGRAHTLNARLQAQLKSGWKYKLSGSLKMQGDVHTPEYFLTNTGKREANIALQVDKKCSEKFQLNTYYSLFSTKIGILRGSHIGNLTDLQIALTRQEPFFTQPDFSYQIQAPRQEVVHQLLKIEAAHFVDNSQFWKFRYAGQLNQRKEYDVRRNSQNKAPTLSLLQHTHWLEAQHQKTFAAKFQTKIGLQSSFVQNQNQAGTGISPLIPDYWGVMGAGFAMLEKRWQKLDIEFGTRYELKQFGVRSRGQTFAHTFHNYAVGLGLKYPIFPMLSFTYEGGYAQRAPEINELYSFGLHQGVSGIEEGNRNLSPERAFKNTATFQLQTPNNRFRAEVGGFYQHFLNYIYLQPQPDFRLTIRGAFPVFKYEQTQAQILGTYLNISYLAHKNIQISGKYSLTRGQDLQQNIPLVAIPTDNWSAYLDVFLPKISRFENNYVKLNGQFVRNQTRLLANQDFLSPPPAYYLAGFRVGTSVVFGKTRLNFSLEAQNLLNQKYRDYLNRQRYFADEMGRNFVLRTNFIFG